MNKLISWHESWNQHMSMNVVAYIYIICTLSGYHAPLDVYKALNGHEILSHINQFPEVTEVNVCVGKEWHRFPSSFFLPNKR